MSFTLNIFLSVFIWYFLFLVLSVLKKKKKTHAFQKSNAFKFTIMSFFLFFLYVFQTELICRCFRVERARTTKALILLLENLLVFLLFMDADSSDVYGLKKESFVELKRGVCFCKHFIFKLQTCAFFS